jgi:WD40 repeat protein
MPTLMKGSGIRVRKLRWRFIVLIVATIAGLAFWLIPRSPGLPVIARASGSKSPVRPLAFSPDGSILAVGQATGNVQLIDSATGNIRTTLQDVGVLDQAAVFSADGRMLAVSTHNLSTKSFTITVFDLPAGRPLAKIDVSAPIMAHFRFSPDGSSLNVIRWDNWFKETDPWQYMSWDTATWKERENRSLPLKQASIVAFSPDGQTMAAAGRNAASVTLWDVATDKQLALLDRNDLRTPADVWSLSFSPDGRTLAVGRNVGDLEIWDLETRSLRAELLGHSKRYSLQHAEFATSREMIASMGMNWAPPPIFNQIAWAARSALSPRGAGRPPRPPPLTEVIVWDLASRRPRVKLQNEAFPVLSPDGKIMATTSTGGDITLWDISGK